MKKLNKPNKYNENNVEFYSSEIGPVTPPSQTNNNNQYAGGGAGGGAGAGTSGGNSNGNSNTGFGDALAEALKKWLSSK